MNIRNFISKAALLSLIGFLVYRWRSKSQNIFLEIVILLIMAITAIVLIDVLILWWHHLSFWAPKQPE